MEEKKGFFKGMLLTFIAFVLAFVLFVKVGNYHIVVYHATTGNTDSKAVTVSDIDFSSVVSKIRSLNKIIEDTYLFDYDTNEVVEDLYKGYIAGLNDKYTSYYTKEEYNDLMSDSSGTYKGIGVSISKEEDGRILIKEVFADSPAKKAGIEVDDELKAVNDKEISKFETTTDIVKEIKGNDKAKLKVYRASTDKTLEVEVELADVDQNTVNYKMLDSKVGYLQITKFEDVTTEQFENAMKALDKKGMESLVLDIRDNPGGTLSSVVNVADYLLPKGKILSIEDKNGNKKEYKSDASAFGKPMAVLINGNSASASEVLAGAIKDYKAGTLIGTTSFGKGIVQNIYSLSDGSGLKLTTAKYYTPAGNYIHGKGIEPDIKIEQSKDTKNDNVLNKAIETLTKED